ncbi:hypothetical protein [Planctomicrobium piriforme]|uniref:Uncharacterized protein n=1 Tax=Planctomicrobium piriforme TaxID=1576369 RepID=A0A1I3E7T2_9PLAN|nr:hypothetical protein [Planctomicrobium piriforme]SFH94939.1 hypothetical protein SAMN05421753_104110 [Planctomicrobium piriforme]
MAELSIQLTKKQQELLLRGLRFVRSSVALDTRDYSEQVGEQRTSQYADIAAMESLVSGAKIVETAAAV